MVDTHTSATAKVQEIEFDIALTVETGGTKNAGGQLTVMGVGVGGKAETSTRSSTISRVKFSVPVILPSAGKSWK